jgi:hypothetical protein
MPFAPFAIFMPFKSFTDFTLPESSRSLRTMIPPVKLCLGRI